MGHGTVRSTDIRACHKSATAVWAGGTIISLARLAYRINGILNSGTKSGDSPTADRPTDDIDGWTPKKVNPSAGRDHWSTAGIALLAGGGIRSATVVGKTNALAEQPTEEPYYTEDVAATIYHCLGIPLETTHQTPDGRPVQVNY